MFRLPTIILTILIAWLPQLTQAQTNIASIQDTPDALWNLDESGFIFKGYDVVSVFDNPDYPLNRQAETKSQHTGGYFPTPLPGNPAITSTWKNLKLAFANQANKIRFDNTPEGLKSYWLPKFGGYCAKALASGYLVDIDPKASMVIPDHQGNLIFFTQANTIARTSYSQNLVALYPQSEQHWNTLINGNQQTIEHYKDVGITGLLEAGFNALLSFIDPTPDASKLQLPPL